MQRAERDGFETFTSYIDTLFAGYCWETIMHLKTWLWIRRAGFVALAALMPLTSAWAADVQAPVSERFADAHGQEEPSFQRHVLPLMGRLGCNGRACHGSFQGQGGFRLSLFGYDFKADHDALTAGEKPRVNLKNPAESLIVFKPTHEDEHEGGQRMEEGSWQHHIFLRWIEAGAKDDSTEQASLTRLEVIPAEIQFKTEGEAVKLQAIAHWSNGDREIVTPISRFQTNDGSVAEVDENGAVTCTGQGDTHIIVFYDNGIASVPVIQPISPEVAANYPQVPTPTKVDELVVQKLKKLGIVPSELSSDAEFLRRVSLDMTGTLPTPDEIKAFLADKSADKRAQKIDELLERPTYAAWWATRLCDITGNNAQQLPNNAFRNEDSKQWYDWIEKRIADNVPYDQIIASIVLATGRSAGQSYEDYCEEMSQYYRKKDPRSFADHDTLPHFWARRNVRTPEDKALAFAYAFLGVRLQCAQCHKHPFDQWSQQDFEHFQAFFTNIQYGNNPASSKERAQMLEALGLGGKKPNNEVQKKLQAIAAKGEPIPLQELFVRETNNNRNRNNKGKNSGSSRVITPKVLGGEEVDSHESDLRHSLMDWLRSPQNPYFARAIVNRVWANYFNVGIIEPADDQNLANPPSNEALLAYLTQEFVAHGYDLKWLHRTIANSRTYQLSWRPNPTNRLDTRNFSRAVPRRLPAEVAYDALNFATASDAEMARLLTDVSQRAIGPTSGYQQNGGRGASYALATFGKPARLTNCDCERSMEPSLLQTLFLRNDGEMLSLLERNNGWLAEVGKAEKSNSSQRESPRDEEFTVEQLERARTKAQQILAKLDKKKDEKEYKKALLRKNRIELQLIAMRKAEAKPATPSGDKVDSAVVAQQGAQLVREAYLRTLSRPPQQDELDKSLAYLADSESLSSGLRDLLWALLNTKEFIVNH
jgi:hypothetical protein